MRLKKQLFTLVIMLIGALTASAGIITSTGTKPSVGSGSSSNPYEIRTAEELRWFVRHANEGHPSSNGVLRCDIDLSSICGPTIGSWVPIGHPEVDGYGNYYCGTFDGNGCKITGLYIDGNDFSDDAPIGFVSTGSSSLLIQNITIEGRIVNPTRNTGGFIGQVKYRTRTLTLKNCVSKIDIEVPGNNLGSDYCVGGLIGYQYSNDLIISNCVYDANMNFDVPADSYVGGLVGECVTPSKGIQYCSSNTHNGLPMIGILDVFCKWGQPGDVTYCISDGPLFGICLLSNTAKSLSTEHCFYASENIYNTLTKTYEDSDVEHTDTGSQKISSKDLTSGKACYDMNSTIGSTVYFQTLGTDKVPYPYTARSRVYKVKNYTDCQTYVDGYSNINEDITTNRVHDFQDGQATCTHCNAPNPSGHAHDGDYYTLATKDDVLWFWSMVNDYGITELKVRLTADIDMESEKMAPLKTYIGEIDGAGHTLSNLNINSSGNNDAGLVGCLKDGGSIHDLTISGNIMTSDALYVGGFAGRAMATASLCNLRNDCSIFVYGYYNGFMEIRIGGIAGSLWGNAEQCLNNGSVTYISQNYTSYSNKVYIAGLVGFAESSAVMNLLANNALVGASTMEQTYSKAIVNYTSLNHTPSGMYYANDIKNPGYSHFGSSTSNAGETPISRTAVGSGELCFTLNNNSEPPVFGQTIGTDLVPFIGVSDAHKQVYNTKSYYNCVDSYSDYSNSNEDGKPLDSHDYNTDGYCTRCYHAKLNQDANHIYQITSAADWECFAKALNAASNAGAAARFASAALTADITIDVSNFVDLKRDGTKQYASLVNLYGSIYGQGHTITFDNVSESCIYYLASNVQNSGSVSDLNVSTVYYRNKIIEINNGKLSVCSSPEGAIYSTNYGLVSDCFSTQYFNIHSSGAGYLVRCLQYISNTSTYTLRSKSSESTECYLRENFTAAQASSGELAYYISHLDIAQPCVWGQTLGTDAAPKLCYGQTPASPTFVTSVTSYSVANPEGAISYVNSGSSLSLTKGEFKVLSDPEAWSDAALSMPNIIARNANGTYAANQINLDPTAAIYLPLQVNAEEFSFINTNNDGQLTTALIYSSGDVVSLIFPVDMPVSNINGTVYLFDAFDADKLVFTSMLDIEYVPANTPMLVKSTGGSILKENPTNVVVMPMDQARFVEDVDARHLTSYKQETLPTSKTVEDMCYVVYYVLNSAGSKASPASASLNTANQLQAYFRVPYVGSLDDEEPEPEPGLDVVLSDTRELRTSFSMDCDLFSLPYGKVTDGVWASVPHLNATNNAVFYGNDIDADNYADITAYDLIYITGNPNQTYNFYINGSEPTQVTLDADGDGFLDLSEIGGTIHLRGIRTEAGTIDPAASAKIYKALFDDDLNYVGISLSGYGTLPDEHKEYALYDASNISSGITLALSNPNALVVGGPNVKGVTNRIVATDQVMQGFTAPSLSIVDGHELCYDFSVECPSVAYNRGDISAETTYASAILPFTVKVNAGDKVYQYSHCDGNNVHFVTPVDEIPAYTPIVADVAELTDLSLSGENLQSLVPNGTFNITKSVNGENVAYFGYVTKRQENVSVESTEVADYNLYGYSSASHRFVKVGKTFSISPFRTFFLLPKPAQAIGCGAPANSPSSLGIVIDGQEIGDEPTGIEDVMIGSGDDDAPTYNLQGIPVGPGYRGLAIRNGKKIYIK